MREAKVRRGWRTALVATTALAAGCSSGSGTGPTLGSACADYANNVCTAAQKCEPGVLDYFYPGGLPSCVSASALACQAAIEAPHSGATTALFQQCGRALAAMTCTEYDSATNDPSCLPQGGTISLGGSCGDPWQCATGRCAFSGTGCGTCVAQAGLGAPCIGVECADGLVCTASASGSTSTVCAKPVPLGGPCFDSSVCPGNAICGRTTGTCDPLPGGGQACDTMDMFCDFSQGLFLCDPYLAVCEAPAAPAQPGQTCGWITTTAPYVPCDGLCILNPGSNAGTCFSQIAQGQACTSADLCGYNLQCVGGVCVPLGPTACDGTPVDAGWTPVDAGTDTALEAGSTALDASSN
jgi:hypothetical protein